MTSKYKFSVLSILLIMAMLCSFVILPVSATDDFETKSSSKIAPALLEKMDMVEPSEKIKVWIWFNDIDKTNIVKETKEICGYSLDELTIDYAKPSKEVSEFISGDLTESKSFTNDMLSQFIKDILSKSEEIKEKTQIYNSTFRRVASEMYVSHNYAVIEKLNLNNRDAIFVSELTPSMITLLNKSEILRLSKDDSITKINYYDDSIEELSDYENREETGYEHEINRMNIAATDRVRDTFGVSGDGVNVLVVDFDYIRSDMGYYSDIANVNKTRNVYNKTVYSTTATNVLPAAEYTHGNLVSAILQTVAEDVFIYSVKIHQYGDIEWAILNCGIEIINGSLNHGAATSYSDSPVAQWYDAIVSTYDIAFVASAGNHLEHYSTNWPNVLSPACGYNSIAVGAFNIDTGVMKNFRYNPNNSALVRNKPDVVVGAASTSAAAPYVTGIACLMIEAHSSIASNPSLVKAILMASCHERALPISGDTQENKYNNLTLKQGAGVIDAYRALCITLLGNYGSGNISSGSIDVKTIKLNANDDVNVSLVWPLNNSVIMGTTPTTNSPTIGTIQNLQLRIYNNNTLVDNSNVANSGKQLTYFAGTANNEYKIKITKNTQNSYIVPFAYAWSTNTIKELDYVNLNGVMAKGKTMHVTAHCNNGTYVSNLNLNYQWKASSDKQTWSNISGATSSSYTLTNNEILKYIRCEVTPKVGSGIVPNMMPVVSNNRVVLYGDVDQDGTIKTRDATTLQKYLANTITLNVEQRLAGDVNGDGAITTADATLIQNYVAHVIDVFPVE